MSDTKVLEQKIKDLEEKIKKLEGELEYYSEERKWMDQLYEQAEKLVIKNKKATAFFLQRHLLIDFQRASELLKKLEENGIVGKDLGFEARKVLK